MKKIYTECPFYCVPRLTIALQKNGFQVNHKHVARLQKELGLKTIYPHPKIQTSNPAPDHHTYPYLLRGIMPERLNHIWSTDITYTKINGRNAYVIAIIDWFRRKVLTWRVTNTMDTYQCIEVLSEALRKYPKPEIFNSDQGSQFTSNSFVDLLKGNVIKISMDGRGRCRDNAKMERFWWALKYEDLKIKEYQTLPLLRKGVSNYVTFYNTKRLHTALPNYQTPDECYFNATKTFQTA